MDKDREDPGTPAATGEGGESSGDKRAAEPCACQSLQAGVSRSVELAPGAGTAELWQQGIVHVEFNVPFPVEWLVAEWSSLVAVVGKLGADIAAHRRMLEKYRPWKVGLTFAHNSAEKLKYLDRERFFTFKFPPGFDVERIAEEFRSLPHVLRAAPEPRIGPPSPPTDPLVNDGGAPLGLALRNNDPQNQWYIFRCLVNQAWQNHGVSGKGVVIADIDWGFFTEHQDLFNRVAVKFNSIDSSPNINLGARLDHGTAALGIAGAENNGKGIAGVAFDATLWAIQAGTVLPGQSCSLGSALDWVKAIDHVCDTPSAGRKVIMLEAQTCIGRNIEGVDVINKAIRDAINKYNIAVCVAAGDSGNDAGVDGTGQAITPTNSILVGATDYFDDPNDLQRSAHSNWGTRIVVSAPGDVSCDVTCCSCGIDRYRNNFGGTSGALPKVAGTVALMLEANNALTHDAVRNILSTCGPTIQSDPLHPIGCFLNAENAVQGALKMLAPQEEGPSLLGTLKHGIALLKAHLLGSHI